MGLFDRFKTSEAATERRSLRRRPSCETNQQDAASFPSLTTTPASSRLGARAHGAPHRRRGRRHRVDLAGGVRRALTSRLVGAERIQATGLGFSYASRFAEHIHEVLTLDLPDCGGDAARLAHRRDRRRVPSLVNRGRTNLLELLETTPVDVQRIGEGGRSVYAVLGDSPYTASFARFLNDAAYRWLPEVDDRNGFVFALPYRHAIILQPCSTPAEIRDALELVPDYAQRMHDEGVSPVSMHAYHWLGRQITCLTTEEDDGTMSVHPSEALEQSWVWVAGPADPADRVARCSAERHEPR